MNRIRTIMGMGYFLVKTLHTLIWVLMVSAIGLILGAGLTGVITPMVWGGVIVIILEGIVLLVNGGTCPLTPLAARYTSDRAENFDIFLPRWLARNNKRIFTPIAVTGIVLVIYQALR